MIAAQLSPRIYPALETVLAQVERDFAEEIAALADLIADAQEDPIWVAEVQKSVQAGTVQADKRPEEHIAQLILELVVE